MARRSPPTATTLGSRTRRGERRFDKSKMCCHRRYEVLLDGCATLLAWHHWELTLVTDGHIYHAPPPKAEHRISKGTIPLFLRMFSVCQTFVLTL
jgi:hypothetical protein